MLPLYHIVSFHDMTISCIHRNLYESHDISIYIYIYTVYRTIVEKRCCGCTVVSRANLVQGPKGLKLSKLYTVDPRIHQNLTNFFSAAPTKFLSVSSHLFFEKL